MHREETFEFFVGDMVQVVFEPYYDCPFTWVTDMDRYCGELVQITNKNYKSGKGCYGYRISADGGSYVWCGNCFIPVVETPDFDITDEEFDKLLLFGKG